MEHLHETYSWPLIILSIVISVFASYCALDVYERMTQLSGRTKTLWMGFGSVAMGLGIWSMHFIGMLAVHLPIEVHYDILLVSVSLVLPMAAAWAALFVITSRSFSRTRFVIGGACMGVAIAGMHYTGMEAMRFQGVIHYRWPLVTASVLFAFFISYAALCLPYFRRQNAQASSLWGKGTASGLLGAAIAGMHYIGMAAVDFSANAASVVLPPREEGANVALLASWIGAATLFILLLIVVNLAMDRRYALRMAGMSKQRYDSIFEHNPDLVCLFDTEGRLLRTNPAAEQMTGYSMDMFLNKSFTAFLNRKDALKIRCAFKRALEGTPQTVECSLRHRNGHSIWLSTTIVPLAVDGNVVDVYTISKDMTEYRKAQRELLQAKREAEQAAQSKSEFLAIMSHEVRTPLNGVIGMSQLLQDTGLTEEQRSYVQIISKSGTALLSVINDVLDFSKMESGKMALQSEPFHFQECLRETLMLFTPQVQQRRLRLGWQADEHIPEVLWGDESRLRQVLINLIGNAVKFTEQGGIDVIVRVASRREEDMCLEFVVRDTGIGIPQEQQTFLFQPFHQLPSTAAGKQGGTGLGLAISKKLVELMGGQIGVQSAPGQGSTFSFTILARTGERKEAVSQR